ncbi:MAG: hypothetical protein GEV08_06970, partial [Acidimicrobiia bacterium]|nr:hypothetical protein [Acidimicrobiia bacterium]
MDVESAGPGAPGGGGGSVERPGPGSGSAWAWRVAEPGPLGERPTGPRGGDGPLAGWRLAVKDLIAVAGQPLRAGSAARSDARPELADAPVVAQLRAAGSRLVGATRLHEFAFGTTGLNALGTPDNPAAPGRAP